MKFHEFEEKVNQAIYVSATPSDYEREKCPVFVEQIIRPTGWWTRNRSETGQRPNRRLTEEIRRTVEKGYRVLVTTLTKRMAEDLTDYLTRRVSMSAISIRISPPLNERKSSPIFEKASLMSWWVLICFEKDWTCRRWLWLPFWMRTRKDFYVRRPL